MLGMIGIYRIVLEGLCLRLRFFSPFRAYFVLLQSTRIELLTGAVDDLNVRHARAGSEQDEAPEWGSL